MKKPLRWKVQRAAGGGWQGVIELGADDEGRAALACKVGDFATKEQAFRAARNMAERLAGEVEHVLPERTLGALDELGFVSITDGLAVAKGLTKGISSLLRKKKKKGQQAAPAAAPAAAQASTARQGGTRAPGATRSNAQAPATGPNAPATKADLEAIVRTFRERG